MTEQKIYPISAIPPLCRENGQCIVDVDTIRELLKALSLFPLPHVLYFRVTYRTDIYNV